MHIEKMQDVPKAFDAAAFVNEKYADCIKNTVENAHGVLDVP